MHSRTVVDKRESKCSTHRFGALSACSYASEPVTALMSKKPSALLADGSRHSRPRYLLVGCVLCPTCLLIWLRPVGHNRLPARHGNMGVSGVWCQVAQASPES